MSAPAKEFDKHCLLCVLERHTAPEERPMLFCVATDVMPLMAVVPGAQEERPPMLAFADCCRRHSVAFAKGLARLAELSPIIEEYSGAPNDPEEAAKSMARTKRMAVELELEMQDRFDKREGL